jgi:hypothetical protein
MITNKKENTIALLKGDICKNCIFLIHKTMIDILEKNYKFLKRYVVLEGDYISLKPPHCAYLHNGLFTQKSEVDLYGCCQHYVAVIPHVNASIRRYN